MALRRLSTAEMVQVSEPWVTKGSPARKAIDGVDELKGIIARVDAAHAQLHATQPQPDNPRLAALSKEETAQDLRHDNKIRGVHGLLSALALLAGSDDQAAEILGLRDSLLPDRLEATQKTYRAEAGAAALLKTRLDDDPKLKKQLKAIPALGKDALHFVEGWMADAKRLGQLEDERAKLIGNAGPTDGSKVVAARNKWIRAVNALVASAELAEISAEVDSTVFGAMRLAEKTADRRGRDGEEPAAPAVDPAPAPGGGSPAT